MVMGQRTVESHAVFFVPHLKEGMSLLDCGCGPGSITVGLARAVFPGPVVGIDIDESDVSKAEELARALGDQNAAFRRADVYSLPFADETFDAVFAHGVLEHLVEPVTALREMARVLKPGGLIGARSPDYGGHIYYPHDPLIDESLRLIEQVVGHNGGNRNIGRQLKASLMEAGIERVEASASYECSGSPDQTRLEGESMSLIFLESSFRDIVVEERWADAGRLDEISSAWKLWGERPDAFRASAWCEVVGWKS
jgi:ubiquinone/menaquinone biosynthesis C-methylase UbiE